MESPRNRSIIPAILGALGLGLGSCLGGTWAYAPWTGDADSGITNTSAYTVAVNCNGAAVTVNGVPFEASTPSGANFALGGAVNPWGPGGSPNISGDSLTLAQSFIYNGDPRTVTLSNLTPGTTYETSIFSFGWEDSGRTLIFTSGSDRAVVNQDIYGNGNGIRITYTFVAMASSQVVTVAPSVPGYTLHMAALANRTVGVAAGGTWAYAPWTGDADSGITSASAYTVAVNCNGAAVTVNGVPFQASATSGANFALGGTVVTWGPGGAPSISGNSGSLAQGFIYAGDPRSVTLNNLTPGTSYETSFFSYGWEDPGARPQTFASGSSSAVVDQDSYGNRNGIRITYTFVASASTQLLTVTPNISGATLHMVALANRTLGTSPGISNGAFGANAFGFVAWPGYFSGSNPASATGWSFTANAGLGGVNGAGTVTGVFGPANQTTSSNGNAIGAYALIQTAGTFTQTFSDAAGTAYQLFFDASGRWLGTPWAENDVIAASVAGASLTTPDLDETQFVGYFLPFTGAGSDTVEIVNGGGEVVFTNVVVAKASNSGIWQGACSGNLGGADKNFGGGALTFGQAGMANSTLQFLDTDGDGKIVWNTSLTAVDGGVSAGTLAFNNTALNYTLNSADATGVTGATALTKTGPGRLTLSGANTYTGATTVNAGTLQCSNGGAVGSTSKITVHTGASIYFDSGAKGGTIGAPIELSGVGNGVGSGDGALHSYFEGGQITFTGPITLLGDSKIQAYAAGSTLAFSGAIGGTGNLTFFANGAAPDHHDFLVLSGASNFSGDLYIDNYAARAQVTLSGGANRLPTTAVVHLGAGVWNPAVSSVVELSGNDQTLAGLADSGVSSLAGPRSIVNTSGTAATLTLNAPSDQSFSGTIGGADIYDTAGNNLALVKSGGGKQTLTGANTYSGNTTVNGGTLSLGQVNSNNESSTVSIAAAAGAKLDLAFSGTDTVGMLFINGVQQPAGDYTSAHPSAALTGGGTLHVATGPAGFASWISGTFANGNVPSNKQGATDDPDHDGISNLMEYALAGLDPTVSNGAIGTFGGHTLSYPKRQPLATDLTYVIETSPDLRQPWTPQVTQGPSNTDATISYALPAGQGKLFARLRVEQQP